MAGIRARHQCSAQHGVTPMKKFESFCDSVLSGIPRATKGERADIREELLDHLESHKEVLMGYGVEEEQAEREAVETMGDAGKIGAAWNSMLSPFWLWLGRICTVCCVLLVLWVIGRSGYRLEMIWNVWQVQNGYTTVKLDEIKGYDLVWEKDPGICEEFGQHMVKIPKVALWQKAWGKDSFELQVYVITYPQELLGYPLPMNPFLWRLESNLHDSGGSGVEFNQQGFSEVRRNYDVEKGAESVILDFELYGNTFHAEIPLEWEGV